MWKSLSLAACVLFLTGCMTSIADGRSYSGPDSTYTSSHNAAETSQCIQKRWQQVFAANPSSVWLTDKDVEGRYTVYLRDFIYLADVNDEKVGSKVVYYHNGDHLWGTKERLVSAIKSCL